MGPLLGPRDGSLLLEMQLVLEGPWGWAKLFLFHWGDPFPGLEIDIASSLGPHYIFLPSWFFFPLSLPLSYKGSPFCAFFFHSVS